MAFRVKQTAEADHDLDLILEWLMARQAGETGLRWLEGLKDTIDSLTNLPHRCSLAPESVAFHFEVRQLLQGANRINTGCSSLSRQTQSSSFTFAMAADCPLPSVCGHTVHYMLKIESLMCLSLFR